MKPGTGVRVVSVVLALLLVVPTLVICATAFTDGTAVQFPPRGFSLRWFGEVLTDPRWTAAFGHSVEVGLLAAAFAMAGGTCLALGAAKGRGRLAGLMSAVGMLPMIVPLVVGAIGFYLVYTPLGLTGNVLGIAVAHGVLGLPYTFVNVLAALTGIDDRLEEAAEIHGASKAVTLFTITLPLVLPSTLIGGLLAFISSWDEVVVANFLSSPRFQTLPVLMYSQIRTGVEPSVSAVAAIVTGVTLVIAVVAFATPPLITRLRSRSS